MATTKTTTATAAKKGKAAAKTVDPKNNPDFRAVRNLTPEAGPNFSYATGQIIYLPKDRAKQRVDAGKAEWLESDEQMVAAAKGAVADNEKLKAQNEALQAEVAALRDVAKERDEARAKVDELRAALGVTDEAEGEAA